MSHAVVRGEPSAAQLYLDEILNEILRGKGVASDAAARKQITMAEIAYHCLRKEPNHLFMINGATGEKTTNEQLLKRTVSLARSIIAKGLKGKTVFVVMRNHKHLAAVYWAIMFSGVVPYMMDPNATVYEFNHFLKLTEPCYVFCDREHNDIVHKALEDIPDVKPNVVISDDEEALADFVNGYSDSVDNFKIPEGSPDAAVMLLPTSGSTGLPKAAVLTDKGLSTQLPSWWDEHTTFPTPTELVMILTNAQWMTFTMMMTTCVAYRISALMTPKQVTVEHVTDMLEKFRPTWVYLNPAFAKELVATISADQLASIKTLSLLGSPSTPDLMATFKEKIPNTTQLCDAYGTTEFHGLMSKTDKDAPFTSCGRIINIMQYKIIDDNGNEVKPGMQGEGELYVKGECGFKTYYKNDHLFNESMNDGWFKTGDCFRVDENERLFFAERKKFNFKYKGSQVAPEEIETVIGAIPGIQESVVCGTEQGAAAGVVLSPGWSVTREQIHQLVNSTLSDHKRLHGGIAFIASVPLTHSGKLQRSECKKIIHDLKDKGLCF